MGEGGRGTQEKTGTNDTTNTTDERIERSDAEEKTDALPDHGNVPVFEGTLELVSIGGRFAVDVGLGVVDIGAGVVALVRDDLLVVHSVGHGVNGK